MLKSLVFTTPPSGDKWAITWNDQLLTHVTIQPDGQYLIDHDGMFAFLPADKFYISPVAGLDALYNQLLSMAVSLLVQFFNNKALTPNETTKSS